MIIITLFFCYLKKKNLYCSYLVYILHSTYREQIVLSCIESTAKMALKTWTERWVLITVLFFYSTQAEMTEIFIHGEKSE